MGWGICFSLDENYNLYCSDGCRWRTSDSDYNGFPEWPSARRQVLEYYERDAHSELDMIRDECPGTAAALASACPEYLGAAFQSYDNLSNEEKQELHEQCLTEFKLEFNSASDALEIVKKSLIDEEKRFKNFKSKKCRTRVEQIEEDIRRLQSELPYQKLVEEMKHLKKSKARASKLLRLEQKFNTN